MNKKTTQQTTALGYASLLLVAAWQAARIEGAEKAPAVLAEVEKKIEEGTASLVMSVQRIGGTVRLTVAVLDATGFSNIFDQAVLDLTGPLIVSREQLAHVAIVNPENLN